MTRVALALALALLAGSAQARPPENADPALAPWFQSLRTDKGVSCCSLADCRPVEYRTTGDHYEALIKPPEFDVDSPEWVPVPQSHILKRTQNPVGRAVACWEPFSGILCFVLPAQV
jgi:hypothetical protein